MTDTRIVAMEDGTFVPQYKVEHFLWGHHWESLYLKEDNLWSTSCSKFAAKEAKTSKEKAEVLIQQFLRTKEDRKRLRDD